MMRMQKTTLATPIKPRDMIANMMRIGASRAIAKEQIARLRRLEYWGNDVYSAAVDRESEHAMGPGCSVVHISFHRRDRDVVRDWRDVQQIKSDILGAEVEAVEMYPAESRVVDTANEYHLWAIVPDDGSTYRIPFGFFGGMRTNDAGVPGAKQRPREEAACATK